MRKLIFFIILILLAIGIGYLVHHDSGYVLVSYGTWSLETSLWIGIIAFIIFFLIIYWLVRILFHLTHLGSRFQRWGNKHRQAKSKKFSHTGLRDLVEGNYTKAENSLSKLAKEEDGDLVNYLGAAFAAQEQQAFDRRDWYLEQAKKNHEDAETAIEVTKARLQVYGRQWPEAVAHLQDLQIKFPKNKNIMRLLLTCYQHTKNWGEINILLPLLRKNKVLPSDELDQIEIACRNNLLNELIQDNAHEKITAFWENLSKAHQASGTLLKKYIQYLLRDQQYEKALKLIENSLKKQWDASLLLLYLAAKGEPNKQLQSVTAWLKQHPEDAILLYVAGVLSQREALLGQAREYLEASIKLHPDPKAYQALAEVLELLQKHDQAVNCYQQGLKHSLRACRIE